MGGKIAMQLTSQHPQNIKGLICIESPPVDLTEAQGYAKVIRDYVIRCTGISFEIISRYFQQK